MSIAKLTNLGGYQVRNQALIFAMAKKMKLLGFPNEMCNNFDGFQKIDLGTLSPILDRSIIVTLDEEFC